MLLLKKVEESGGDKGLETQRKIGLILLELERYPEAVEVARQRGVKIPGVTA